MHRLSRLRRVRRSIALVAAALTLPAAARAEGPGEPDHEIAPQVVFYTGDALRGMTLGGLEYTYRAWDEVFLAVGVQAGELLVDDEVALEARSGDGFGVATLAAVWSFPIRFGLEDDAPIADFYTSAGPSYFRLGDTNAWGGFIGGGLTVQTGWSWLALRADLKSFFYSVRNLGGQNLNVDVSLALGPAIEL